MKNKKIVFSFDRDGTIDVNPLDIDRQSIPLKWVQYLAHETDHEVWAHGNQKLKAEAGIPGRSELLEMYTEKFGDPIKQVNNRIHKDLELPLSVETSKAVPDPDIVTAAANYYKQGTSPRKQQSLRLLTKLVPDADEYVCVDNQYLGYVSGWTFYYPHEFVKEYEDDLTDQVAALNSTNLQDQARRTGYTPEKSGENIGVSLVSSVGQRMPRGIRERFEVRPDRIIPIGIRERSSDSTDREQ